MPILGSQGSGAKGAPTAPTVGTATVTNSTTVSLEFTASSSKLPITSYTVTSSPSIALTTTGTTSPLTVTGSFETNTTYTFTITATSDAGNSLSSSVSNSVTPKTLIVGDTGPGGGIIFYDAGSTLSWGRYLEVATSSNWSRTFAPWSGNTGTLVGTSSSIGQGRTNTLAAITQSNTAGRGITLARNFSGGGFTSNSTCWHLPSLDEAIALRDAVLANTNGVATKSGFVTEAEYWTSTEINSSQVYAIRMYSFASSTFNTGKNTNIWIWPVRTF